MVQLAITVKMLGKLEVRAKETVQSSCSADDKLYLPCYLVLSQNGAPHGTPISTHKCHNSYYIKGSPERYPCKYEPCSLCHPHIFP